MENAWRKKLSFYFSCLLNKNRQNDAITWQANRYLSRRKSGGN